MDVPLFHLDGIGNRMLIAIIAITHVVINHPMAVGAYPLITAMEWYGRYRNDPRWDALAYRIMFVTFLITTSLGALTGVGIWLSSALVSPFGIGSLLRVFFWNWLFEWSIFVTEVVLILSYYKTWDRWTEGRAKSRHILLGAALGLFSWITMAVIVAILAFMMSTGSWTTDRSILSATLNPLYLPQLAFRTFFALATAGLYAWFLIAVFLRKDDPFRPSAVRFAAAWTLAFAPLCMLAAAWYWGRVPELFAANVNVGLLTQRFAEWHSLFLKLSGGVVLSLVAIATVGLVRPTYVPRTGLMIAFLLAVGLLAHFERAREFIRKPFVIADYMYSNGVRVDQLALFQEEGILTHSTYGNPGPITDDNRVLAGRQVFLLACTRCHTTSGMNGVISKFEKLYGADPWNPTQVSTFIANMHLTRTYMPPFPGNQDELQALTAYLCQLQASPASLPGAQSDGVGDIARAGSREVERPLSSLALSTGEAAAEDGARK